VAGAFGTLASVVLGGIGALAATLVIGLATNTIRNVQDTTR